MLDYIIVGCGLAGLCFAEKLSKEGKSFVVFDSEQRSSSLAAGGMYNPVVLKRFTDVWKIKEQLELAKPFYDALEVKLDVVFNHKVPLYRRLASVEEQNNWFTASDRPNLSPYLASSLIKTKVDGIDSPYGFGEVLESGFVDTKALFAGYKHYLKSLDRYLIEHFDYDALSYNEDFVEYKNITAKYVIFAEGFGMLQNPFFKELPLDGTKGELLLVRIPNFKSDVMFKAGVFIIPIGDDLFKVGATYDWNDKTDEPTQAGLDELLEGLKDLINCDFEVIQHTAGVRPTVKDRRPLLGRSLESNRLFVLNGLGTRGVLLGPFLADKLYNYIEHNEELEEGVSIHRYKKFRLK